MFENPRRGRQVRNFTTNVPKILDLKSTSEKIFFRKLSLGAPVIGQHTPYYTLEIERKPCGYFRSEPDYVTFQRHLHSGKNIKGPQWIFRVPRFPLIEAIGSRDYEAKWGQNSVLKVCARGWMSKITIVIVRNF